MSSRRLLPLALALTALSPAMASADTLTPPLTIPTWLSARPVALTLTATDPAAELRSERLLLRREIDTLEYEKGQLTMAGPIALVVIGSLMVTPIFVAPLLLLVPDEDCSGCDAWGYGLLAVSAAGTAMGIIGLVQLLSRSESRHALDAQIRRKQNRLNQLDIELKATPGGAVAALTFTH